MSGTTTHFAQLRLALAALAPGPLTLSSTSIRDVPVPTGLGSEAQVQMVVRSDTLLVKNTDARVVFDKGGVAHAESTRADDTSHVD